MKKTILLAMFLLVLGSGTAWAQPRLEMDTYTCEIAEPVDEGRVVRGTFWARNTGTETLTITEVVPGCGCVASFFDASIQPGEKGRIDLKFDTRQLHGRVRKRAVVVTNDPQSPKTLIDMIVEVR